jgi:hypothetical protein
LSFVALACWSFASPLGAAPDEHSHIIRADALDHGQIGTNSFPHNQVLVTFKVPVSINEAKFWMTCWQFHATIPASCSPQWPTSEKLVFTTTHVGHYPPLYYAFVGTGSLISQQRSGIYAMRLVSAGASAFMLALCAYGVAKWSRRRYIVVGVFVSLTPITLFLASSVNPSGFEIVTAICLWTLAIILALDYPSDPPKELVVLIGATASVLALVRGLSPLWVALVGLTIAVLVGSRHVLHYFRARRDVRVAAVVVAVAGALAALWIFTQGTLNVLASHVAIEPATSEFQTLHLVANHGYQWLREGVGVLGWLDTPMPLNFYQAWYLLLAIVLAVAFMHATWRQRTWTIALCVIVLRDSRRHRCPSGQGQWHCLAGARRDATGGGAADSRRGSVGAPNESGRCRTRVGVVDYRHRVRARTDRLLRQSSSVRRRNQRPAVVRPPSSRVVAADGPTAHAGGLRRRCRGTRHVDDLVDLFAPGWCARGDWINRRQARAQICLTRNY